MIIIVKKIIHVISDTNVGGAGRWLLNYIKYYDRKKFNVKVILPVKSQMISLLEPFGVEIFEAPYMADKSFDLKAVSYLSNILKKEAPDILHTHASLSARVAGAGARIGCIINTRHCIEAIPTGVGGFIKGLVNERFSNYFIAVCDAVRVNLENSGISKDKIKVIYNGVEPARVLGDRQKAEIKERYKINQDDIVLGIMARLEPVKGHQYLLAAIKDSTVDNLRCIIAGTGSKEQELARLAKELGIEDKVIFTGYLKDTTEVLNIMDINVLSSESEAMSLSILESMSVGIPTIATDVGGNSELVVDGKTGFLVKQKDERDLANAIDKLASNKELIKSLGAEASRVYNERFTASISTVALEKFYLEVLGNGC